jgi:hypothetical protein
MVALSEGTTELVLTRGETVLIDREDWERAIGFNWYLQHGYAVGKPQWVSISLHRFIMNAPYGVEVDHINGNPLDCRKSNLRLCSRAQNARNSKKRVGGTSRFKGVYFESQTRKWRAVITVDYKSIRLGRFLSEIDAALAYNAAAIEHHGEFARLNPL